MKSTFNKTALLVATVLNLTLFLATSQAATRTWSGSGADANWSTPANWGGTAPANADLLIFSGTTQQNNTNNIANLSINGMQLANGGFTLNGASGNVLALNGPLTNTAGLNNLALGMNVTAQNAVWNIAPGSELRISGTFSNTTTANPLATLSFGGAVRFTSNNCLPNRFFTLTSGSVIADGCVLTTLDGFRLQPPSGSTAVFQITNNGSVTIGSGGNLRLCQTAIGGSSRVDMASGILNMAITSGAGAGDIFVGEAASTTTVFNQNGGLVEFTGNGNNRIAFANTSATANGTYNLNGGILLTKQVVQVTAGSPGGTFNFNGGILKPTSGSTSFFQGVQTANVQAGGAIIDTTNLNITIGQSLAGSGPLTKLGSGSLTLSGVNTYTGATTASNGTLSITTGTLTGGGGLSVASGATLSLTNTGSSMSVSSLTTGSTGTNTLQFNFPSGNPGSASIIAGNVTANGYVAINIVGNGLTAGTFPLINFTSASGLANFHLASVPPGVFASLTTSGSSVQLQIISIGKALVWSGAVDANWNTTTANWFDLGNGNNPTNYSQPSGIGDLVTFDDSLTANPAVNLALAVSPGTMTFNNNGAVYSFTGSGRISGITTLIKGGFQSVTLGTSNDYVGGTTLNAGIIYLGAAQALGSGAAILNLGTIASDSGAPRALSNPLIQNADTGVILGDTVNTGTLTLAGGLDLGGGTARTLNFNSDVVISGSLTNGGIATKTGPGAMIIKGNSFQSALASQQQGDVIVDGGQFINFDGWRLQNVFAGTDLHLIVTNGGVFNATVGGNTGNLRIGLAGGDNSANNIMDISGTVNLTPASAIVAGNNAISLGLSGANDLLNLRSGGLLLCRAIVAGGPANTELHLDGGTLTPIANEPAFLQGLTNAFMENGGVTVDTTNFSITIAQGLLASGTGGLTKLGTGTLTLSGANTYTGPTTVSAGKLVLGLAHNASGGITVASNATLAFLSASPGATVRVSNATSSNGAALEAEFSGLTNNPIAPAGFITNLALNGTLKMNLVAANVKIGQFPLIGYGAISGTGNIVAGQLPQGVVGSLVTNTAAKTIDLVVTSVTPLIWKGSVSANWDLVTTNWSLSASPAVYAQGDNVLFDDSGSNSSVSMTLALAPGGVTISNSAQAYQFSTSGPGSLGGSMSLVKDGTNTLTLSAANTYSGATTAKAGTLVAGSATAFGATTAAVSIQNGASLNVNGNNLDIKPAIVGGSGVGGVGALINAVDQNNVLRDVTLTSDTVIRADATFGIRMPADTDPGFRGNGYKLTKVGSGQVNLNGGQANAGSTIWDCDLGDINIMEGRVSFERRMMMGRTTNNYAVRVWPGAGVQLFALNSSMPVPTKPVFLTNATFVANGNTAADGSTFAGPVTITGDSNAFTALTGVTLTLNGNIAGAGSFASSGSIMLGGINTYTGATTITNGTLQIAGGASMANSASIDVGASATFDVSAVAPWTLGANQTLAGNGTVNGSVQANGTVSPGDSIGALTFNNDLTLAGTNIMELTKDGGLTNDQITVNGTLSYGGRLNVVLTGTTPLAVNDTFKLFNFGSAPSGSFAMSLPSGYTWDTSQLSVDGTITVTAVTARPHPGFTSVTISGNSIVLSGTNATGTYILYSSTNPTLPVVSWTPEFTNTFTGPFSFTNAINAPQKFYLLQ